MILNKSYRILPVLLLGILLLGSCNKDEETPPYDDSAEYQELAEQMEYERLLLNLFGQLSGEMSPAIGKCIDQAHPDEVWMVASDLQDAYERFVELIVPGGAESTGLRVEDEHTLLELCGARLDFGPSTEAAAIAEVKVDIPGIDTLRKIYFTTTDLWPLNSGQSPFSLGQIWRYKGDYWICVQESGCVDGIMLSMRTKIPDENIVKYSDHTHFQDTIKLLDCGASKEAWIAFRDLRSIHPQRIMSNYLELERLATHSVNAQDTRMRDTYDILRDILISPYAPLPSQLLAGHKDPYFLPTSVFQTGSANVKSKYAWIPPYYYYIVEGDYYWGSKSENSIVHYKTEKKNDVPTESSYSAEYRFDSNLTGPAFKNEFEKWEKITNM